MGVPAYSPLIYQIKPALLKAIMMKTALAPIPAPISAAPLEDLYDLLAPDMEATNALILDRLQSSVDDIPKIARYLIESGGKRIRPLLTLACAALFAPPDGRAHKLATAVEFIHSATLLHDDVVDGSETRRGQVVANMTFGNKPAVLVGDFLFARAFELMVETENLRVLHLLSRAAGIIVEGEVDQLSNARDLSVTMEGYVRIVSAKTAALFAAASAAGPALYGADQTAQDALYQYGHHLGIAFQIADDVLDYTGEASAFGKQPGNDFVEGKMTAPVLFALSHAGETERTFWHRTFVDGDQTDADMQTARQYLLQHDAFSKSHALAETHRDLAVAALAPLQGHTIKGILADLATYAVRRNR
jgi:octaprenyl-diphosphate synthase